MSYQKTHSTTFTSRTGKTVEIALFQDLSITVGTKDLPLIESPDNEEIIVQTSSDQGEGIITAYFNASFVREPLDDVYDIFVALSKTVLNKPYIRIISGGVTIFQGSAEKDTVEFSNVYETEVLNVSFRSPLALLQEQAGVFLHNSIYNSSNPFHLANSTNTAEQKAPLADVINTFMIRAVDPGAAATLKVFTNFDASSGGINYNLFRNTFVNPFFLDEDEPWSNLLLATMRAFFMTIGYSMTQGDYLICEYNPAEDYNESLLFDVLAENTSGLRTVTTTSIAPQTVDFADVLENGPNGNVYSLSKRYREIITTQDGQSFANIAPATFDNFRRYPISVEFDIDTTVNSRKGLDVYDGSGYNQHFVEHSVTLNAPDRIYREIGELYGVHLFEQQIIIKATVFGIIDPALPFRYRPYDHDFVVYQMRTINSVVNFLEESTRFEALRVRDISRPIGQIAGCVMHLRADKGVTTTSTGRVTAWADQSGEGNNATEETSGSGPTLQFDRLNGRPVLSFNGGYLTFPDLGGANADRDWIIVARSNANSASDCIIQEGDNSSGILRILDNLDLTTQADSVSFSDNIDKNQFDLIEVNTAFDNDLEFATIMLNGTSLTRTGTASTIIDTTGKGFIGADENGSAGLRLWEGLIAEVICFQFGITATERGYIRDYLRAKYKLNIA